jgi:hypothetical protein
MVLPDFPAGTEGFTYDEETGQLLDPDGKPVYLFDEAYQMWKPVMPDDAGEGSVLEQDEEGNWVVQNSEDNENVLFWDPVTNDWQPYGPDGEKGEATEEIVPPEIPVDVAATLPEGFQLTQDDNGVWQILSAEGDVLYAYDEASGTWIAEAPVDESGTSTAPEIPQEILDTLPADFSAQQTADGVWQLLDGDGNVLYTQDENGEWIVTEPAPPAEEGNESVNVACTSGEPSQLGVGDTAEVQTGLNLRSSSGISTNLVGGMATGTQVTVIGGPDCVAHEDGAYVWWNIELPDGSTGWAAEAALYGGFYFMTPVK